MRCKRKSVCSIAAAGGIAWLMTGLPGWTSHCAAQAAKTAPGARQQPATGVSSGPGATVLSPDPYRVESAGLSFYVPERATLKSATAGGEPSFQIMAEDATWWIDVRTPATSNAELTVTDAGEAALQQLLSRYGEEEGTTIRTVGRVLEKIDRLVTDASRPDLEAFRFYVALPQVGKDVAIVRGYTLWKVSSNRFVAFELTTTEAEFPRVKGVYETVSGAARFEDMSAVMSQRALAIKAGMSLLERVGATEMKEAIAVRHDRLERLYVPAPTAADSDAREIAYRRIRCHEGQRGELDPTRPKSRWSAADRQPGYLLQVDARYLDGSSRIVDMESLFFMSADRNEEAWTIRQALREGGKVVTTAETGARNGLSMTVRTEISGQPNPQVFSPRFESEAYISQVESYLLPQLLIGARLPATYGFYVFQSRDGRCKLRTDVLEQPADRPGLWRLTTSFADEPQKTRQVSLYNDAGELIRTELPDGMVWEPIELDRLVRLWRTKDLPMK